MHARILYLWLVIGLVMAGLAFPADSVEAMEPGQVGSLPQVELLKSDADGIVFRVRVQDVAVDKVVAGGRSWDTVTIPGFFASEVVGNPQVPVRRVLLGIPLQADYDIGVALGQPVSLQGEYDLVPAPRPVPMTDTGPAAVEQPFFVSEAGGGEWEFVADPARYATDSFYPASVAGIEDSGFIRNQRFLAVQISPVKYNPVAKEIVVHEEILVEITFRYPKGEALGSWQSAGAFEQVLASAVLNYESAREWRGKETGHDEQAQPMLLDEPAYKILVNQEGVFEVTRAELEAVDVPVTTIDPETFKVFYRGTEVPIRVFETGGVLDSLWFYAEELDTKFTNTNVYWLTYDGASGLRMSSKSAPPVAPGTVVVSEDYTTTLHLEEDDYYRPQMPWDAASDHWLWIDTAYPSPQPILSFYTSVSHVVTESYSTTLTSLMIGITDFPEDPDHCVDFYLNDNYVDGYLWNGLGVEQLVSMPAPSPFLVEGQNEIRVEGCPTAASVDKVWYDWFDLEVRREYVAESDLLVFDVPRANEQYELGGFSDSAIEIFDVSDVYNPTFLVDFTATLSGTEYIAAFHDPVAAPGGRYLAVTRDELQSASGIVLDDPSSLTDPNNQADYVIITPEELLTGIQPLVDYRAAQGLTVSVVDLVDVFDEFNYGIYDPEAIRDFLAYAYASWWPPAPTYVLLVGDGTYDFKNNMNTSDPVLMPPYLAFVDPWIGETAADNRYVSVSGVDILPDMFIGRLPVANSAQLQNILTKTMSYETAPPEDGWNQQLLFTTDNPDDAGDFYQYSDDLVNNYVPAPYVSSKAYNGLGCVGTGCRAQIINTLNTTSTLLINYIGHAGNQQWASEAILRVADLGSVAVNDRWPISLAMTCLEGYFHYPAFPSLGEAYVRQDQKGWVASWSPTGLGVAHGHDRLSKGFLEAVFYDGIRDLGLATYLGKSNLYQSGISLDQVDTYHLFGDPALHINALDADIQVAKTAEPAVVAPGGVLTYTLTFTNAGPATAHHVVLTDIVPADLMSPTVVYSSPEVLGQELGPDFTWTVTDLLPHTGGEIQFTAMVEPGVAPGATVINEAEISMAEPDLDPANNTATATVDVALSDLYVSGVGPEAVNPGEVFTYSIAWGNMGGGLMLTPRLTNTLPSGVSYVGDDSGWTPEEPAPGVVVWQGTSQQLPPGWGETLVVTVQVSATLEPPATLNFGASIGSDAQDADTTNNEDEWATEAVPAGGSQYIYLPIVVRNLP